MNRKIAKEIKGFDIEIKKIISIKAPIKDKTRDLNPTQLQILRYLSDHENEDICQKDIEKEINLKKASITGALDSMEDKGVIVRVACKDDRRKKFIKVSEHAKKQRDEFIKTIRYIDETLVNGLSEKELQTFFNVLDKMRKNLEKMNETNN